MIQKTLHRICQKSKKLNYCRKDCVYISHLPFKRIGNKRFTYLSYSDIMIDMDKTTKIINMTFRLRFFLYSDRDLKTYLSPTCTSVFQITETKNISGKCHFGQRNIGTDPRKFPLFLLSRILVTFINFSSDRK